MEVRLNSPSATKTTQERPRFPAASPSSLSQPREFGHSLCHLSGDGEGTAHSVLLPPTSNSGKNEFQPSAWPMGRCLGFGALLGCSCCPPLGMCSWGGGRSCLDVATKWTATDLRERFGRPCPALPLLHAIHRGQWRERVTWVEFCHRLPLKRLRGHSLWPLPCLNQGLFQGPCPAPGPAAWRSQCLRFGDTSSSPSTPRHIQGHLQPRMLPGQEICISQACLSHGTPP